MRGFHPIGDKMVVRRASAEEVSAGGIVLPETSREMPCEGKVLAVGAGRRLSSGELAEPSVKAGDTVIFSRFAGTNIKIDGEELMLLSELDIYAVVEPDA